MTPQAGASTRQRTSIDSINAGGLGWSGWLACVVALVRVCTNGQFRFGGNGHTLAPLLCLFFSLANPTQANMPSLSSSCTGQQQTDRRVRRLCFRVVGLGLVAYHANARGARQSIDRMQSPAAPKKGSGQQLPPCLHGRDLARSDLDLPLRSCASPSFVGEPSGGYQGREGRALWGAASHGRDGHKRRTLTRAIDRITPSHTFNQMAK